MKELIVTYVGQKGEMKTEMPTCVLPSVLSELSFFPLNDSRTV